MNRSRRIAKFVDGTSQTLMAAEVKNEELGGPTFAAINSRSYHPGGVNALLADGSVRFVKSTIEGMVWRGLGTVAGGEVVLIRFLLLSCTAGGQLHGFCLNRVATRPATAAGMPSFFSFDYGLVNNTALLDVNPSHWVHLP
jgi:prepilin-type processing-associated H-X9-DG protein